MEYYNEGVTPKKKEPDLSGSNTLKSFIPLSYGFRSSYKSIAVNAAINPMIIDATIAIVPNS